MKRAVKSPNRVIANSNDNNDSHSYNNDLEGLNLKQVTEIVEKDNKNDSKPKTEENKSQQRKKWTPKVQYELR